MITRIAFAAAVLGLSACAGQAPENLRVADARLQVERIRGDAAVARYAPVQLQEAQQWLSRAEADARSGDELALEHHVTMTNRSVEVAVAHAHAMATREQAAALAQQAQLRAGEERAARIEQELQGLRQTPQGAVLTLTDLLFERGKAALRPGALNRMQPLAAYLRQHPEVHATIEGFTDSTGNPETNRSLSQARAEAVRDYLIGEGIEPARVTARGKGEDFPIASNATASGRQANRRVEVLLSQAPGD
jgi:outer membrane protein OmpA-like peptidoglycan-associated protein